MAWRGSAWLGPSMHGGLTEEDIRRIQALHEALQGRRPRVELHLDGLAHRALRLLGHLTRMRADQLTPAVSLGMPAFGTGDSTPLNRNTPESVVLPLHHGPVADLVTSRSRVAYRGLTRYLRW